MATMLISCLISAYPPSVRRSLSPEKRGDITISAYVEKEEERVSLELTHWRNSDYSSDTVINNTNIQPTTYLLCPPSLTIGHLEKLLRLKYDLKPTHHRVEFFLNANRDEDVFSADYTLSDLVCLNSLTKTSSAAAWQNKRRDYCYRGLRPMKLFFSISPITTVCNHQLQQNGKMEAAEQEEDGTEQVPATNVQAFLLTNGS